MRHDRNSSEDDEREDDEERGPRKPRKPTRTYKVKCSMCARALNCPESKDGDLFLLEKNRQCVSSNADDSCKVAVSAKSNQAYAASLKG